MTDSDLPAPEAIADPVEAMYADLDRLVKSLGLMGEPSLSASVSSVSSKALLMAAASAFESSTVEMIAGVAEQVGSPLLANFAVNQGLKRKFHTLFSWESGNANAFYKLFGDEFSKGAKEAEADDEVFRAAVRSFVYLGHQRNQLVHGNFAAFNLVHTLGELIEKYRSAKLFLPRIQGLLVAGLPKGED